MSAREIAEPRTILRATVGSTLHGLALAGSDDTDEMGVCVEPPEYVVGLSHFEQWCYRTQPEGHRSGPGDLDLTIYSLRKWCRLAANGNPTILLLLFAPPEFCKVRMPLGVWLLTRAGELERELKDLLDSSPLPDEPDREAINNFLSDIYLGWWEGTA